MSGDAIVLPAESDLTSERVWPSIALDALAPLFGMALIGSFWWFGGLALQANPRLSAFAGFAPAPALVSFVQLIASGDAWAAAAPSLGRCLGGSPLR